jgi:hypothetical protein
MLTPLSPLSTLGVADAPSNTASAHQFLTPSPTSGRRGVHFVDTLRAGVPIPWIDFSRGWRQVRLDTWVHPVEVSDGWSIEVVARDNSLGAQAGGAAGYFGAFELTSIPRLWGVDPLSAVDTFLVRALALEVFDSLRSLPGVICDPDTDQLRLTRLDVATDFAIGEGVSVPGFSTEYSWDGRVETVVSRPRARPGARSKGPVVDRMYDKARQMATVHGIEDYPRCIRIERQVRRSALPSDRRIVMLTDETLEAIGRDCAANVVPGDITAESVLINRALVAGLAVRDVQMLVGYLRTRQVLGSEMNRNTRIKYEQMALDLGVGGILDGSDNPVSVSVDWDAQLIELCAD